MIAINIVNPSGGCNTYSKLQKKYGGKYILSDKPRGKVIVASKDLAKAFKIAEKKGYQNPAIEYIEPEGVIIMYNGSILAGRRNSYFSSSNLNLTWRVN